MKRSFFHLVTLYLLTWIPISSAQVPTLDPEKTVNPATGEMAFRLPLGHVKGTAANAEFPVDLAYKAGIRINQPASDVGLGFSVGGGAIVRKTVLIPDNAEDYVEREEINDCDLDPWREALAYLITGVVIALGVVLSCFDPASGSALLYIAAQVAANALPLVGAVLTSVSFSPEDYTAGGTHLPSYDYQRGNGKGFFQGGEDTDLPDLYFVSTPYFSGNFIFVGKDLSSGYFVPQVTSGTGAGPERTVLLEYDLSNETFSLTLADGTILVFEGIFTTFDLQATEGYVRADGKADCHYRLKTGCESVVSEWNLTKVLFPDFSGDADKLGEASSTGNWVKLSYVTDTYYGNVYGFPRQVSKRDIVYPYAHLEPIPGSSSHGRPSSQDKYNMNKPRLTSIETPIDKAEFVYSKKRVDDKYYSTTISPGFKNVIRTYHLTQIRFGVKDGEEPRTVVDFQKQYLLRGGSECASQIYFPGPGWPPDVNSGSHALTLTGVKYSAPSEAATYTVNFRYDPRQNYSLNNQFGTCPDGSKTKNAKFMVEERDLWGYYLPNSSNHNSFNQTGKLKTDPKADGKPYAAAWSVAGIDLPSGLNIDWIYESNKYDAVNGRTGSTKYGGGIRVKKMIVNSGNNTHPERTYNYFYTDMKEAGKFEEDLSSTSGHATVEPFPYLEAHDPRPTTVRGGFYTGAKVAYERCIVVENYNAEHKQSGQPKCPLGYTAFDYITSKDEPNHGPYGDIDRSYARGMISALTKYNSGNEIIAKSEWEYEVFVEGEVVQGIECYNRSTMNRGRSVGRSGVVRLKSKKGTLDKVSSTTDYNYAKTNREIPDATDFKKPYVSSVSVCPYAEIPNCDGGNNYDGSIYSKLIEGKSLVTKHLSNTSLPDLVIVSDWEYRCSSTDPKKRKFVLRVLADIQVDNRTGMLSGRWSHNSITIRDDQAGTELLGIGIGNFNDGEISDDVIVAWKGSGNNIRLRYLYDLRFDDNNTVSFDETAGPTGCDINTSTQTHNLHNRWTDCAFGEIDGGGLDMVCTRVNDCFPLLVVLDVDPRAESNCSKGVYTARYYYDGAVFIDELAEKSLPINTKHIQLVEDDLYLYSLEQTYAQRTPKDLQKHLNMKRHSVPSIWVNNLTGEINFKGKENLEDACNLNPTTMNDAFTLFASDLTDGDPFGRNKEHFVSAVVTDRDENLPMYCVLQNDGHLGAFVYGPRQIRDLNGLPQRTVATSPEGHKQIVERRPAFAGSQQRMGERHMYTQSDRTVVYRKPGIGHEYPASASQIVWEANGGTWRHKSTLRWKADPIGREDYPYPPILEPDEYPANWLTQQENMRFSRLGHPTEVFDHGKPRCFIYGGRGNILSARVDNSNFEECGVLTCDYDNDEVIDFNYEDHTSPSFDAENGWKKGGANLAKDGEGLWGETCIKVVNNWGPARSFKMSPNTDYIMSAWVKVKASDRNERFIMHGDYRKTSDTEYPYYMPPRPNGGGPTDKFRNFSVKAAVIEAPKNTDEEKWQYVEMRIPAKSDLSQENGWYALVFYGTPPTETIDGGTAYLQDVRFYPTDAIVTSTYYDHTHNLPRVTLDANGQPGRKVSYDGYGRPVTWEEAVFNENGTFREWMIVQEREYHLTTDYTIPEFTSIPYSTPFYMENTEVTQNAYEFVLKENPSRAKGLALPVNNVSLYDAILYCNARSVIEGYEKVYTYSDEEYDGLNCIMLENLQADHSKNGYRLPTKAEWQFAYRGGTERLFHWTDNETQRCQTIDEYEWHYGNTSGDQTPRAVGAKKPNGYGLYDMAGNVTEWAWLGGGVQVVGGNIYRSCGDSDKPFSYEFDYSTDAELERRTTSFVNIGFRVVRNK